MKKLISVFAALALVGAVAAKPKPAPKKPAGKPAPAVAAPTAPAPAAAAATAMAASKGSNFQIGVSGGYNIHLNTTVNSVSSTPAGAGGIYGGADFLLGQSFKYGLGVSYFQTNTTSGATEAMLPIVAKVRYHFIPMVYAGINGGYGIDLGTKVSGRTNTFIPIGGELGLALDFGSVGLDIGAQFTYTILSQKTDATALTAETTVSGSTMFVTPYLRLNFQF